MNNRTLNLYRDKVKNLNREDLETLAAEALYHLQCVSGSRNSFDFSKLDPVVGVPPRIPEVERMHHEAADFIHENGI